MSMVINPARFSSAGGDPDFSSVKYLSGFEGADASTSFVDESSVGRAMTAVGNAQVDTAQFKYGASSLLVDGTGDYLTSPSSSDFDLGSGLFTIEGWVRPTSNAANWGLVSRRLVSGTSGWALYYSSTALRFLGGRSGGDVGATSGAWTPTLGTWYHLCAERRSDGDVYLYRDGVVVANSTGMTGRIIGAGTGILTVGALDLNGSFFGYNGHVDEVRVTVGVARYNGAFTPPTAAFPRS